MRLAKYLCVFTIELVRVYQRRAMLRRTDCLPFTLKGLAYWCHVTAAWAAKHDAPWAACVNRSALSQLMMNWWEDEALSPVK